MTERRPPPGPFKHEREQLRLVGTMVTHAGAVRRGNEDTVLYTIPEPGRSDRSRDALLLVADGMGGHAAGGVASAMAAERVQHVFRFSHGSVPSVLAECFEVANNAIYQHGLTNADSAGLGTTCTALVVRAGCVFLGHVGDSRAYIFRKGELRQLSTDHTLVADLVRSGTITSKEAAVRSDRNVVLRALGVRSEIEPEIWEHGLPLLLDDRLVLCSDGLTDLVSEALISQLVESLSPVDACDGLLKSALLGGGYDNVSVGVFRVIKNDEIPT